VTTLEASVHTAEPVQKTKGGCEVGLTVKMVDDEDLARWQASLVPGRVVTVADADD